MRRISALLTGVLCLTVAGRAFAADQPLSPIGEWITQDHESVVEIAPCGSGLCGTIVGLRHNHPPGEVPKDVHNSDAAKRDAPLCGLLILGSFKPASGDPGKWEDGWAYDPDSGSTYSGNFTLDGTDTLKLRGFIGISLFGRTETWTREGPEPHNRCSAPSASPNP